MAKSDEKRIDKSLWEEISGLDKYRNQRSDGRIFFTHNNKQYEGSLYIIEGLDWKVWTCEDVDIIHQNSDKNLLHSIIAAVVAPGAFGPGAFGPGAFGPGAFGPEGKVSGFPPGLQAPWQVRGFTASAGRAVHKTGATRKGQFVYMGRAYRPFSAMRQARSHTRQEYPHSLSYQATSLTILPSCTAV